MSVENNYTDELSLKELSKKIIRISNKKKKTFTLLFLGIMLLSAAYFIKVIIKPSYKSEVVLKSRFIKKETLGKVLDNYNNAISDEKNQLSNELKLIFEKNNIVKLEAQEIKADISSPDRNDATKYYTLVTIYSQKPSSDNIENVNAIINDIKLNATIDNDIAIGKTKTEEAIAELDTLLKTALPAGNSFKNRLEGNSTMLVMNDLYRSLNELLSRKSQLKTELMYYQTENLIFKISPLVLKKTISFPLAIFAIGLGIWFLICTFWIGGIIVFGDEE
jgi:regulator of replication initiation timing